MRLEDKIGQRIIGYYTSQRSKKKRAAYHLALLYFRHSKAQIPEEEAIAACIEGLYWLKTAGCPLLIDLVEPDLFYLRSQLYQKIKRNKSCLVTGRTKTR